MAYSCIIVDYIKINFWKNGRSKDSAVKNYTFLAKMCDFLEGECSLGRPLIMYENTTPTITSNYEKDAYWLKKERYLPSPILYIPTNFQYFEPTAYYLRYTMTKHKPTDSRLFKNNYHKCPLLYLLWQNVRVLPLLESASSFVHLCTYISHDSV